jgi:hypothetical protein
VRTGAALGLLRGLGVADGVAALVAAYAIVKSAARLRYGVDYSDEAFYAVLPHRFALGDRPFVDEINLRQSFAYITLPFYWAYLKVNRSTSGVLLFLRHLYFVFTFVAAFAVYRAARQWLTHAAALMVASLAVVFVPFNIPTCSYNTLGCTFLTAGFFLTLQRVARRTSWRTAYFGGVSLGLATIAYPPLAVAVVTVTLLAPWVDEDRARRFRNAAIHVAGGLTPALAIAPLLFAAGPSGIREAFAYESALTKPRTIDKLYLVFEDVFRFAPLQPRLLLALALIFLLVRTFRKLRVVAVPAFAVAFAAWAADPETKGQSAHVVALWLNIYLAWAGFLLLLLRGVDRPARRAVVVILVPSAVAALVNGFSSDNGAINAGLGAFPAAVFALILAASELESFGRMRGAVVRTATVTGAVALVGTVALWHVSRAYSYVYRDQPIAVLDTRVPLGPYRGLYTTAARANEIVEVTQVMRQFEDRTARVFSYFDFPAGYLTTRMGVAMPSAWTDARLQPSPFMMDYYHAHRTGRGLIMRWPVGWDGPELAALIDPSRILHRGASGWILYREPPPP